MKVTIDLDNITPIYKLPGSAFMFMFEFISYADSKGVIELTAYRREAIQTKLDYGHNMLSKALKHCVDTGIFDKVRNGTYKINPNIFTIK